jgi:hypothetical protein
MFDNRGELWCREAMKLTSCIALSFGIGLLGCAADAPPPVAATSAGVLICEPYDPAYCDPAYFCDVNAQFITCNDSTPFLAVHTPDCRWCMERNICDDHWGPTLCP